MASPDLNTHVRNLNATGQNVTTGPVRVSGFVITNAISPVATAFVQIFNAAAANVTLGTTVPLMSIHVAGAAIAVGGTLVVALVTPMFFDTALSVFGTTTAEGNAGTADGVFVQVWVE